LSWPGLTDKLLEMKDIVALIDGAEMKTAIPKPGASDLRATIKLRHYLLR
jgi:hypothetical protein